MRRRSGVYRYTYDRTQVASFGVANYYAFVGASKRGRIDKPMTFLGVENFEQNLGKPDYRNFGYAGIAASLVLKQNTPIHFQRVVGGAYRYANLVFGQHTTDATKVSDAPSGSFASIKNPESWDGTATIVTDYTPMLLAYSIGPGADYNEYEMRIVSGNMRDVTITTPAAFIDNDDSILVNGYYQYAVLAVNALGTTKAASTGELQVNLGLAPNDNTVQFAFSKVEAATGYMIFRRFNAAVSTGVGPDIYELYATIPQVGASATTVTFQDIGQYEQDNTNTLIVDGSDLKLNVNGVGQVYTKSKEFTLEIYDPRINNSQPIESFVVTYDAATDAENQQTGIEEVVNDEVLGSQQIRIFKAAGPFTDDQKYFYTTPRAKMLYGADGSTYANLDDATFITGLDKFSNPDDYEVSMFLAGGRNTIAFLQAIGSMCTTRNDAHFIGGIPQEYEVGTKAITWRTLLLGMNTRRGELHFPHIEYYDSYSSEILDVPADVITGAMYARNDSLYGIYNATAGVKRGVINDITGVRGVTQKYSTTELTAFANAQLNPIANIRGYGLTIRDQLTLQTTITAFSYFSVSRLIDAIELSIAAFAITKIQDLPNELLDGDMEAAINAILQLMQNRGAISAYQVFVGNEAGNTPDLAIQGIRKYKIAVTPNIPVREIELHTYVTKEGVSFEEIVQSEAA